jgi:hypothetical protein
MYASSHQTYGGSTARPTGRDADLLASLDTEKPTNHSGKKARREKKIARKGRPNEYIVYSNPDKTEHVSPPQDNPCQIGHPSRVVVVGPPGCGKRSVVLNLLRNSVVMFDTITIVHASHHSKELDIFKAPKKSRKRSKSKKKDEADDLLADSDEEDEDEYDCQIWEWDNGQNDMRQDPYGFVGLPPIERFMKQDEDGNNLHNLLIMDEPPSVWNSRMERDMAQYFNYVSTHHNTTIFLVTQFPKSIPTSVRNAATHWVTFPSPGDVHAERFLEQILGNRLRTMFKVMCRQKHDSIMIDKTGMGPRIRRNVYEPINMLEIERPMKQQEMENDECDFDCMRTQDMQGGGQYASDKPKKKRKRLSKGSE